MALGYILDPFIQVNTIIGTPVVGAKIYVYKANTSNLAITYSDFEGHTNTNPVRTNTLGNCTIIAEDNTKYDIEIRDAMNLLLMSKKDISVVGTSGESSDTSIEPGYGIEVTRSGNTFTISVDTDLIATKEDLNDKQDKMHAGDNIEITRQNYINVVNRREIVSQYPVKMDRGNNKLKIYIDEEYLAELERGTDPVSAGIDLVRDGDVIGVNTNSSAFGDYNFVAGYENVVSGDYNAAFGESNDIIGKDNIIYGKSNDGRGNYSFVGGHDNEFNITNCIIGGYENNVQGSNLVVAGNNNDISSCSNSLFAGRNNNIVKFSQGVCLGNDNNVSSPSGASNGIILGAYNNVSSDAYANDKIIGNQNNVFGSQDFVIGLNNAVTGNNKYVIGNNNTASGSDYMYVFGHAASGVNGGLVLGVNGHNNIEVRNNDDIYYRYNNNMVQLKPQTTLVSNGFDKKYSKTITIDADHTARIQATFDISDYKTWVATGLISAPCICKVIVYSDHRTNNAVVDLYAVRDYGGSYNTIFDSWNLRFVDLPAGSITSTYMSWLEANFTFPCSNTAFTAYGDWSPIIYVNSSNNIPFTVGDKVTIVLELHAVKLV